MISRDRARRAAAREPARSASPARTGRRRRRRCSARCFAAAGVPVEVAGNIGRPLTSLVGAVAPDAWVVCELSSFQLEDVETLRPRVAVLLNLEPDHLDRHGTFDAYARREAADLREPGAATTSRSSRAGFGAIPGARAADRVRRRRPAAGRAADPRRAQPRERRRGDRGGAGGRHRRRARSPRRCATFPGVEHRIEQSRSVDGVRYVNDSKATNVAAALRALASFPDAPAARDPRRPRQGEAYAPLAAAFAPATARYLIGEAAAEIAAALAAAGVAFERRGDLAAGGRGGRRGGRAAATSSCSRRPARASTSSRASSSAGRSSAAWCRSSTGDAHASSSSASSSSSRSGSSRSGS